MVENLPGPYEIEFTLTGWLSPARDHVIRMSVAVTGLPPAGTLPTAIDVQKMGGATAKLNVVADQIWSFIRLSYHVAISVTGYTLWKYVPGTLAKDFISAGALTTPTGSSASTPTIAHQTTQTYRSANGGVIKIVLLESSNVGETRITLIPNAAGTPSQRLASYIMSSDNVVLARDDSYPVAALRDARGQNEKIWRLVFR